MKLDPHLPQLPSISELLEHPRVQGIVARVNRSTLAQRAAGFLDELRSSLVGRAGLAEVPPLSHLAERLARRLLGEPVTGGPIVNATGVVVGDPELTPPLAEQAVHAMLQFASEYHPCAPPLIKSLERDLCAITGAGAALALHSFEGAVAVARAAAAGAARRVAVEPLAGAIDPSDYGFQSIEPISARIAAGADLVVVEGAGLLGGPTCGLIVGRRPLVEAAAKSLLAVQLALDSLRAAALHATLQAYHDDQRDSAPFQVPVWQLLSAPLANLQQRAERLSPLMAAGSLAASAEPQQVRSAWRLGSSEQSLASSWGIAVHPASGDCRSLLARLRRGTHPVAAVESAGAVLFDLRAVFPRWDQRLVAAMDDVEG